jgi:muramoyltetrapeptide carboxypeptidase LdcA involved in peptidoglycan recycling
MDRICHNCHRSAARVDGVLYSRKPVPGDRVAVLSPSASLPARFPGVYELGLRRLREQFELVPVEYPTTRAAYATAAERAADIHAAFGDPSISAVLATIGGDDQITVLRHLDAGLLRSHPKPFFGYSDNTNLLNYLWRLGIVGYHGGSVMAHLARGGRLHPAHARSLRDALFGDGWYPLEPPAQWGDETGDWTDPASLEAEPPMWDSDGWDWVATATGVIEGRTWGGNLEIVSWLLQAGQVEESGRYAGCVLMLETSEEMPSATEVYRILRNMGERRLLQQFPAVLIGRPKAWELARRNTPQQKKEYASGQRRAFERAFSEYHPTATLVFDVDIGHTDPQLIVPYGGLVRVEPASRRISVRY